MTKGNDCEVLRGHTSEWCSDLLEIWESARVQRVGRDRVCSSFNTRVRPILSQSSKTTRLCYTAQVLSDWFYNSYDSIWIIRWERLPCWGKLKLVICKKFEHFGKTQIADQIKNKTSVDAGRCMRFKTLCSGKVNLKALLSHQSFSYFHPSHFSPKAVRFLNSSLSNKSTSAVF